MVTISVIIPVYNGEKTIRETIESVRGQTFTDLEIIVINDGSTDSTLDILATIPDPRLKIFSYPNANQAVSRNRGISHATGEFIAFLDADDLWTPDKLEAQLNALQQNPQAALVYSWTNSVNESGEFIRRGSYVSDNGDVYAKLLLVDFLENGSIPLIRRQALAEVGNFDPSLTPAEDWDMWLRLASRYPFVVVPRVQILYRVSADSASTNVTRMESACWRVIEKAFTQAPDSLQYLKQDSIANIYKYLTFKVLQGYPNRQRGITAARLLSQAINYDPSLIRARVLAKVLYTIAVMTVIPSPQAATLLSKVKTLSNLDALLGYLRLTP
ncbi:MAG: glycosyltransferase [Coleofasciculus chthonoplastes F3-SA18-01]|uniref:glycosyltransferase n=1 Tax=Coleofasciculus chthonoplastes TaxID=64178 RepID=UPI0032FF8E39